MGSGVLLFAQGAQVRERFDVGIELFVAAGGGGGGGEHGGGGETSVGSVIVLLLREVAGGVVLGLVVGWLGTVLIKLTRTPAIDILVSLAVVMAGNAMAWKIGVSGPLAMVATGLFLTEGLVLVYPPETHLSLYVTYHVI